MFGWIHIEVEVLGDVSQLEASAVIVVAFGEHLILPHSAGPIIAVRNPFWRAAEGCPCVVVEVQHCYYVEDFSATYWLRRCLDFT